MQMRQFAYEICWILWNPPDFMAWNPPDFMHEICQISWPEISQISCMKSARFHGLKSAEFHAWNPQDFMKSARFHGLKSARFHEIRQISWNPLDFMYFPNEPRTNGPIFNMHLWAKWPKQTYRFVGKLSNNQTHNFSEIYFCFRRSSGPKKYQG